MWLLLLTILAWTLAGVLFASFAEYAVHRWLLHRPLVRHLWHVHAALHHGRYYRVFDHEEDPEGKYVNLAMSPWTTFAACLALLPLLLFSTVGGVVFVLMAILHAVAWNAIHSEMHLNRGRFFSGWGAYRFLKWYHFLHHRHVNRNFNAVLPLADYVLGTAARPTVADVLEWRRLEAESSAPSWG
jgi:hypothetical protein